MKRWTTAALALGLLGISERSHADEVTLPGLMFGGAALSSVLCGAIVLAPTSYHLFREEPAEPEWVRAGVVLGFANMTFGSVWMASGCLDSAAGCRTVAPFAGTQIGLGVLNLAVAYLVQAVDLE